MTDYQRQLILDITCFYQLILRKDKMLSGEPFSLTPELQYQNINYHDTDFSWVDYNYQLYEKLKKHGFDDQWIQKLYISVNHYTLDENAIEKLSGLLPNGLSLLSNTVLPLVEMRNSNTSPERFCVRFIGDIFEKDHWQPPVLETITTLRKVFGLLFLDTEFLKEFGLTLVFEY